MTERLYLADPYLQSFRARVLEMRELDGKPAAILDRSAFYPEGGGQPGDRGRIGDALVLDTQSRGDEILHILDRALDPAEFDARIDWTRRFDHMQQHHGQHLLSAAFDRLHAPTVSFHLGERTCTIDLDAPPDLAKAEEAQRLANESIWRDLPVVARDFSGEERARLPLRKEAVKGDRVVLVEGVDASPCGGTHPARTGEVGCVAILSVQSWGKGKARIEFACGARVVRILAEANNLAARASEALKCAPADLPQTAARVAGESLERRKQIDALLGELAAHEADKLQAAARGADMLQAGARERDKLQFGADAPLPPIVVARIERGAAFAKQVAQALAAQGSTALLGAVDEGRAHLVFAKPKGAPGPAMGALLKDALPLVQGKGGGGPDFAQGSGPEVSRLDDALALARAKLV